MPEDNEITLEGIRAGLRKDLTGVLNEWSKDKAGLLVRQETNEEEAGEKGGLARRVLEPDQIRNAREVLRVAAGQAEAEQNAARAIEGFDWRVPRVMGGGRLPIGSAVVGFGGGTIAGNVVDAVVRPSNSGGGVNFLNPIAHLFAAGFAASSARMVGPTAASFGAGALVLKLALRHTPLAQWLLGINQAVTRPIHGSQTMRQLAGGEAGQDLMPVASPALANTEASVAFG